METEQEIIDRLEKALKNRRRNSLYGKGVYSTKYQGANTEVLMTNSSFDVIEDGKPVTYQGKNTLEVFAVTQLKGVDEVVLLRIGNSEKFAAFCNDSSTGEDEGQKKRDIERSSKKKSGKRVKGEIAYCYSIFIQRRTATNLPYQWFWQVFIGGWQSENILIKEWEVPEDNVNLGKPRNLASPVAIVDFRGGTFYVSLQYTIWASNNTSQQRYALFKGTKKEDLETKWDKSTSEMGYSTLGLSPRGFGYWSSQTIGQTNYSLYDGAITAHPYTFVSNNDATTLIPQGWQNPPKAATYVVTETYVPVESSGTTINLPISIGVVTSSQYTNPPGVNTAPDRYSTVVSSFKGASVDQTYNRTQDLFALYRLSEDGNQFLSASKKIVDASNYSSHSEGNYTYVPTATDLTGQTFTAGNVGGGGTYLGGTLYTYTSTYLEQGAYGGGSSSTVAIKLQESLSYSTEKTSSNITTFTQGSGAPTSNTVTSDPPEIVKLDMPEKGGNLPFMAKLADIGNAFTTPPTKPTIATGSVIPGLTSLAPGAIAGAGSPYLTDVHDDFISAIQCPDLLNRGTVETQNIYGDLSPIYPLVSDAAALSALTGIPDGASYGVTSISKVYTFNLASTAFANGTTVLNASGGTGRWLEKEALPASPANPDPTKLPGAMTVADYFPEIQGTPPTAEWIGYKNIEHENRTVNVFLWNSGLSGPYKTPSIEVDVVKMDAIAKVIADNTLQRLLSYTFMNASFG